MSLPTLLTFQWLPPFGELQPADITICVDQVLADFCRAIDEITQDPQAVSWMSCGQKIEDHSERLSQTWGPVAHLFRVCHDTWDPPFQQNHAKIVSFWTTFFQNRQLYRQYQQLALCTTLTAEQKRAVALTIEQFELNGVGLTDDQQQQFSREQTQLAAQEVLFAQNHLHCTDTFAYFVTTVDDLAGVPTDTKVRLQDTTATDATQRWRLTLQMPCYEPIMRYAHNRALRETLYRAYVTQSSALFAEYDPSFQRHDNAPVVKAILASRNTIAQLLNQPNYAAVSLRSKMARTPAAALSFLEEMVHRARPYAEKEREQMVSFARTEMGIDPLEAWDLAYVAEKMRQTQYALHADELRQYFPIDAVLRGLFYVCHTLFGITFTQVDHGTTWHPDVLIFQISTAQKPCVAYVYMDLYARPGKMSGAWMDECTTPHRTSVPAAYLNSNCTPPTAQQPSLLTHNDVITLFHEMGHCLNHVLSQGEVWSTFGNRGIEWDAIEFPSQFMENFCWDFTALQQMSRHITTGQTVREALFQKMVAAKNFQASAQLLRQLEHSLFDLHLHQNPLADVMDVLQEIRQRVAVFIPPAYDHFPLSFDHIFAGPYAAGYYSYTWAEVLSADAYAAFEENPPVLNATLGKHLYDTVFSRGGSRPAMESFVAFRGREPSLQALLRQMGLLEHAPS